MNNALSKNCPQTLPTIPTLTRENITLVRGDSYSGTFTFKDSVTNTTILLPEGTTGYFKADYGYSGGMVIVSELVIDSENNTASVLLLPEETSLLGSGLSNYYTYKYSMTLTLPDTTVVTYQMGDLYSINNVLPKAAPV